MPPAVGVGVGGRAATDEPRPAACGMAPEPEAGGDLRIAFGDGFGGDLRIAFGGGVGSA